MVESAQFDLELVRCGELIAGPWKHFMSFHKEFALRCLLTECIEQLDRKRYARMYKANSQTEETEELAMQIVLNKAERTLSISNNGIGMDWEDFRDLGRRKNRHVGIANTASTVSEVQSTLQFMNLGLFAAVTLAKCVTLRSKVEGKSAILWRTSDWRAYTLERTAEDPSLDSKDKTGTEITLHLNEEASDVMDTNYVKLLLDRDLSFVVRSYPVHIWDADKGWQTVKKSIPVWQRRPGTVPREDVVAFCQESSQDSTEPFAFKHFNQEGQLEFSAILFVPGTATPVTQRELTLLASGAPVDVRGDLLLPPWLRFLGGVVDTPDLPTCVTADHLENGRVGKVLRRILTKSAVSMFEELAAEEGKAQVLAARFGSNIRQGVAHSALWSKSKLQPRLAALLRFESTQPHAGPVSLADFVRDLAEGASIPYISAEGRRRLGRSSDAEAVVGNPSLSVGPALVLTKEEEEALLSLEGGWSGRSFVAVGCSEEEESATDDEGVEVRVEEQAGGWMLVTQVAGGAYASAALEREEPAQP